MNTANLDKTDIGILRLLQQDALLSNKQLALELNKSTATIHERVRRLKSEGYIKRSVAIVDGKKIGKSLIAYSQVQLKEHTDSALSSFEKEVVKFPEVMECYHMTGAFDFILRIVISDMDAYHNFLRSKLAQLSNIGTVQSFFVMSEIKTETAYPL
ncbi:MAG: Lrp/AsnC family transcriptional regulator [Candidatus Pedobacter colombiensis]|uniref:Lrp/AsnC family transcriptional regulator n=1 Tax=Candidatus Pedobacter colombiensis TaxID=3121371 RepID=A0AAJ5WBR4_9SPHI|nr:Lrp/AsnC family transcriptional regulator [Pedobacter sp.]WEK20549.1 MAG: Lrp/AsnC family transcriptional regulator [Pedobacter sp.]